MDQLTTLPMEVISHIIDETIDKDLYQLKDLFELAKTDNKIHGLLYDSYIWQKAYREKRFTIKNVIKSCLIEIF